MLSDKVPCALSSCVRPSLLVSLGYVPVVFALFFYRRNILGYGRAASQVRLLSYARLTNGRPGPHINMADNNNVSCRSHSPIPLLGPSQERERG